MASEVRVIRTSAKSHTHERHRVNNFSRDVNDGENYTVLLNQLQPQHCSRAPLQTKDLLTRAEQVSVLSALIVTAVV